MRVLVLSVIIAVLYAVSGCGGSTGASTGEQTIPGGVATDLSHDDAQAALNAQRDVEAFAVRLEQVFAGSTYPRDLAGVVTAARKTGLALSPGDSIAGYKYDSSDVEFQLCVESKSGAYAIYDTSPMSVQSAGDTGGCPFG